MSALPVWRTSDAGSALEALARRAGLPVRDTPAPRPPATVGAELGALGAWLEAAGSWLDLEIEPVSAPYPDVDQMLRAAGPALLLVPGEEGGLLALLGPARGDRVRALGPDLREQRIPTGLVVRALCGPMEGPYLGLVSRLLRAAHIAPEAEERVRRQLLRQFIAAMPVEGCWLVRLPPSAALLPQLRAAGVTRAFATLLGAHAVEYGLLLGAWATLGRGALSGGLEAGWLLSWALLLLTAIPFRMLTVHAQGRLSLGFGGVLKRRLLLGALRLDAEEVRHEGAGSFLGRVIESEAVEALALGGGLLAAIALVELGMAGWVLWHGSGGGLHLGMLGLWVGVAVALAALVLRAREAWTRTRLKLTHELVERMVGHRTRLAQQAPERWHDGEDEALERYLRDGGAMDRWTALAGTALPRGWTLLALVGLAPAFVSGADPTALAVGVGGVMLALGALGTLGGGITSLGGAWIAWRQVAPLYRAAGRPEVRPSPSLLFLSAARPAEAAEPGAEEVRGAPVLEAHDLRFRYLDRGEPVLRGCSLEIAEGDRVLLEGPSGGGKSTLASLLVGLRPPSSGLLLLGGLDRATLGSAGWRRRVAAAPQFHENHVLTGTFAFNLLLGRSWPPRQQDLEEAEELCHALGLGPLLARMPAGLQQMVGETGWQLSHGEKSRLYLARALLQRAELIVLDESFAALDPENLALALRATLERAPALVVIAHP